MVRTILISSGCILIPFLGLLGYDGRDPRRMLAVFIAFALSLWGFYRGTEPLKNKWLFLFMGYLLINAWQSPLVSMKFLDQIVTQFQFWQPFAITIVFFLLYVTLQGSKLNKIFVFKVMAWVGFITSLHMIGQAFNFHQWSTPEHYGNMQVGSFLGNPLTAGTFIAMLIPLAIYVRRYFFAVVMAIAVLCTASQIAIWSMVISLFVLLGSWKKNTFILMMVSVLFATTLTVAYLNNDTLKRWITPSDHGRIATWKNIVTDLKNPFVKKKSYGYTGHGYGSFRFFYPKKHPHKQGQRKYDKAHSEPMELLYDTGFVGVGMFVLALFYLFKNVNFSCTQNKFLISSLVCILLSSCGMFVFHMGTHQFYTVVLAGLLTNKESL